MGAAREENGFVDAERKDANLSGIIEFGHAFKKGAYGDDTGRETVQVPPSLDRSRINWLAVCRVASCTAVAFGVDARIVGVDARIGRRSTEALDRRNNGIPRPVARLSMIRPNQPRHAGAAKRARSSGLA